MKFVYFKIPDRGCLSCIYYLSNISRNVLTKAVTRRCPIKLKIAKLTKLTGKCLCWSLFWIKLHHATLLKRDSKVFFWEFWEIFRTPFWKTYVNGCFYFEIVYCSRLKPQWPIWDILQGEPSPGSSREKF